jgi:inosine-uridine nucleoside N-ribohydrolase
MSPVNLFAQKQKVWIDADTGNETDDVYAIVRLLNDTTIKLIGLSSAHFNNPDLLAFKKWNQYNTIGINTVAISQLLNEEILRLSYKLNLAHPLGADRQTGRAWGGYEPRVSKASAGIIDAVKMLKPGEKLDVICLGALTNIASAIELDTSIAPRLRCFLLGARYYSGEKYWDKNEFNIRNDLNAFDYLLNNSGVDLTIMPITTAAGYRFERDALYAEFEGRSPVLNYMKKRWQETNPDDKVRTLWDVAMAEAYLKPSLVKIESALTPPENTPRYIRVYTKIDEQSLKEDFLGVVKKLKNKK